MNKDELIAKVRANLAHVDYLRAKQKCETRELKEQHKRENEEVIEPLQRETRQAQTALEPFCEHPAEERGTCIYTGDYCRLCGHSFDTMFGDPIEEPPVEGA